jgi:hypothetical protein
VPTSQKSTTVADFRHFGEGETFRGTFCH